MNQPRAFTSAIAQGLEHAIDVLAGAGSALDRKPHRFVEHQDIVVFEQGYRAQKRPGLCVGRSSGLQLLRWKSQWRDAHYLSRLQTLLGRGSLPLQPYLPGTNEPL